MVKCFAYMYLCTMRIQCPCRPENGVGSSGTGVPDGCDPPCECWELNQGPRRTVSPLNCLVIAPVLHIDVFCIILYTTHGQGSNTLQVSWSLGTVGPANGESMVVLSKGLHNKRTARRSTHEMETKGGKEILISFSHCYGYTVTLGDSKGREFSQLTN